MKEIRSNVYIALFMAALLTGCGSDKTISGTVIGKDAVVESTTGQIIDENMSASEATTGAVNEGVSEATLKSVGLNSIDVNYGNLEIEESKGKLKITGIDCDPDEAGDIMNATAGQLTTYSDRSCSQFFDIGDFGDGNSHNVELYYMNGNSVCQLNAAYSAVDNQTLVVTFENISRK